MADLQRVAKSSGSIWGKNQFSRPENIEITDVRQHVCIMVNKSLYTRGARFLYEFRKTNIESRHAKHLLELFCAILVDMLEFQAKTLKDADKDDALHENYEQYGAGSIRAYIETVENGYRFHIMCQGECANDIGRGLLRVLQENRSESEKRRSGIGRVANVGEYEGYKAHIGDGAAYARMCDLYTRVNTCSDNMDDVLNLVIDLSKAGNIANPMNIFSLENAGGDADTYLPDGFIDRTPGRCVVFPDPDKVVRLLASQFAPHVLFPMFIPEYQFVRRLQMVEASRRIVESSIEGDIGAYDATVLLGSKLDILMDDPASRRWLQDPVRLLRAEASEYDASTLMDEFYARIWDEESLVSNSGKSIQRWWRTVKHQEIRHVSISDDLTVFGSFVTRLYFQINYHGVVSTAHDIIFKVLIGCLDAYRCDDGLHLNGLATGNSSTGKSFMFDTVKRWLIDGTVIEVTRKTAASDAVEPENPGAFSDRIKFYHEMPAGMIKEGIRENDQAAEMKSALTSAIVTTEYFREDADGHRRKSIIRNNVTGTLWGATNCGMSGISEAMGSRWLQMAMDEKNNERRSIHACKEAERSKTAEDHARDDIFAYECRWRQAAVWIVEKMIHVGLLPDVQMYAAVQIFSRLQKGIKKVRGKTGKRVHPRNLERCTIYARLFTIIAALERVFFLPDAPCCTDDPEITDFLKLRPFLVCTEEIALFVFTMMREQFFNSNAGKILKHIETIWEQAGDQRDYRTQQGPKRDMFNAVQAPTVKDFNYIMLPMKKAHLAKRINILMSTTTGKVSVTDIEVILSDFQSSSSAGKTWTTRDRQDGEIRPLLKAIDDRTNYCVLRDLLTSEHDVNILDVIQCAQHEHVEPQRIITALTPSGAQPYRLLTVDWKPSAATIGTVENYLHVEAADEVILGFSTRGERVTQVNQSFESIAFQRAGQPPLKRVKLRR